MVVPKTPVQKQQDEEKQGSEQLQNSEQQAERKQDTAAKQASYTGDESDDADEEEIDDAGFIGQMLMRLLRGVGAGAVDKLMVERYEGKTDAEREKFAALVERSKFLAERLAQNTTNFHQVTAREAR